MRGQASPTPAHGGRGTGLRSGCLVLLLALAGAPVAAVAQESGFQGFRSPEADTGFACWSLRNSEIRGSDILICMLSGGDRVRLRPDWEARCEYASGPVFVLRPTGRVRRQCEERIGAGDDARTLTPGATWQRAGMRCENRAGTLHCVNRSGRGFRINPRRQELF